MKIGGNDISSIKIGDTPINRIYKDGVIYYQKGPDGNPLSLILTVISDTQIDLSWTNGSTDEDGISIERSTDGVTYSEIHTTAAGVSTYSNTGLTADTLYYYRVRAFKGTEYSEYSNVEVDGNGIIFNDGILVLTLDDIATTVYSTAYPIFTAQGVKATLYITPLGTGGTWSQAREMYNNGMDIQCHTNSHAHLTTLNEQQIIDELQAVNDAFVANSLPVPQHIAYPYGEYNYNVISAIRASGLRKTARTTTDVAPILRDSEKLSLSSVNVDDITTEEMASLKNQMDSVKNNKTALILYMHGVKEIPDLYSISINDLNEIIDYAQSINLPIKTISQLYLLMKKDPVNLQVTDFTLTATGTGIGISTLTLRASEPVTITLTGTAKFYTDAIATQNESSSWFINSSTIDQTRYIRCATGSSVISIPHSKITKWSAWNSSTNAATLDGDLTSFNKLTYMDLLGNNTTTCDLPQLSELTFYRCYGSNTHSGDMSALTDITLIDNISSLSTMSCNIEGLTSLTFVEAIGNVNFTGSISGLTLLQFWDVRGTGLYTIPNVTNIKGLCYLYVHTSITLTSSNVNQILSDFWLNKDEAKIRSNRYINLFGHSGTGAPTGQGITDKTNLQNYRSPNPPGTAALWAVTTR